MQFSDMIKDVAEAVQAFKAAGVEDGKVCLEIAHKLYTQHLDVLSRTEQLDRAESLIKQTIRQMPPNTDDEGEEDPRIVAAKAAEARLMAMTGET